MMEPVAGVPLSVEGVGIYFIEKARRMSEITHITLHIALMMVVCFAAELSSYNDGWYQIFLLNANMTVLVFGVYTESNMVFPISGVARLMTLSSRVVCVSVQVVAMIMYALRKCE